jgi:hypothetical protein
MGNIDKNANFYLIESDLRKREKARKKWEKLRNVILFDTLLKKFNRFFLFNKIIKECH